MGFKAVEEGWEGRTRSEHTALLDARLTLFSRSLLPLLRFQLRCLLVLPYRPEQGE